MGPNVWKYQVSVFKNTPVYVDVIIQHIAMFNRIPSVHLHTASPLPDFQQKLTIHLFQQTHLNSHVTNACQDIIKSKVIPCALNSNGPELMLVYR